MTPSQTSEPTNNIVNRSIQEEDASCKLKNSSCIDTNYQNILVKINVIKQEMNLQKTKSKSTPMNTKKVMFNDQIQKQYAFLDC